jgi:cell division protease FtsH
MVAQYGMSEAIGPIAVETRTPSPLFPLGTVDARDRIAEETAREVDHEVKRLMTEAHETASRLLREHRQALDGVVHLLLEREVVDGEEVRRLLASESGPMLRAAS